MSNSASIKEQLSKNNPFRYNVSLPPETNKSPDLQQLNADISGEIEQMLRDKRRTPSTPAAGLILGGAGAGKTHMLARILRKLRSHGWHAIFVTVKTFHNPESVLHDLLSDIIISLTLKGSGHRSQLDMLLSEMMNSYREQRAKDGFADIDKLNLRTYLMKDMLSIDKNFLNCMLGYLGTQDEAIRANIIQWLRSGLDEEDSLQLGLPFVDVDSMTDAGRENRARKILVSLGLVMGYARVPMMVCFDELDAMPHDKDIINAWGRVISFLVNEAWGMIPLAFMKPDTWNDVFIAVLNDAIIDRLRTKMTMKGCTIEQARQLVYDRIADAFRDEGKKSIDEKYHWLMSGLDAKLKQGTPPRIVLQLANEAIDTPTDPIGTAYGNERRKVLAEPEAWPPNSEHLARALEVWVKLREDCDLATIRDRTDRFMKLSGNISGKKCLFIILTPSIHSKALAAINQGLAFLKKNPDGLCFYVSEKKLHKETWKKVSGKLADLERAGGRIVLLDNTSRVNWYALTSLINTVDNGDVILYTPSGNKIASRDDLKELVKHIGLLDMGPSLPKSAEMPEEKDRHEPSQPVIVVNPDVLAVNLMSVVKSSPVSILSVDKAVELLSQRKIIVSRNELIAFLKSNKAMFKTFHSKNDIIITPADKK